MKQLEQNNKVAFDPGFAPYILVFSTTYNYINDQVRQFKNANQRKQKYKAFEPALIKVCDNLISFYFSGMLYGAYLKNKYKNDPKELDGNDFLGLDIENCKNGDVVIEVSSIEKFIKNNNNNPFASKKIPSQYQILIDSYIEFLEINNYFTTVKTTSDLQIPNLLKYIDKFTDKKLDDLYSTLMQTIKDKKIEKIFLSDYYKNL